MEETKEKPVKEPHPVKQQYTLDEAAEVAREINDVANYEGWMMLSVSGNSYVTQVGLDRFIPWNSDDDERAEDDQGYFEQTLKDYLLQELEKYANDILSVVAQVRTIDQEK